MLNLSEKYKQKQRLNKKLFIPKNEKLAVKKRLKDSILKAELIGQIQGEDIPSVINETYNTSVTMFLNIEIDNIKNAIFLNGILQEMLKAFVIIQYNDVKGNIALGFGYKRLSKVEQNEIVLENNFITNVFTEYMFDETYELLGEYIYFDKIKNKVNKLALYSEMMVKAYIISNKNLWSKWNFILDSNVWYNQLNTMKIYDLLNEVKEIKNKQSKVNNTADNIKFNKQLMKLYGDMEELINE
ncbi:DUF4391 domain-containing protein [Clostridium algidicarnis]|uniref:DUF4391 domain-containing protein n=1 Tax=Clostridium algidicarnis TaxID=37659 RepID=UPI001C0DFD28|nr:DUF4391 domain-containing protein [Clostridium algidicarnis]MBU3193773.1 DUF4391 domain-containing protein [Clostridium algidicarnis]MBU3205360.1 DUF4391 domain-containing protein [Clostridium algidicarnis]